MTSWPLVTMGALIPPPLLAGDVDDALGVVGLGQLEDGADGGDAHADEDERRDDGERDLELLVAMALLRDRLTLVAELHEGVPDQREHEDADDAGGEEHPPLQVLDALGVGALGLPRVLGGVVGASGQRQRERSTGDGQDTTN
jgi:hypothetical protein